MVLQQSFGAAGQQSFGAAGQVTTGIQDRAIKSPYDQRSDVGSLAIVSGNWGGNRNSKATQLHMNEDLRRGPGSIVCLQEASIENGKYLEMPSADYDALHGSPRSRLEELQARPGAQYRVIRGNEDEKSLLIGSRASLTAELQLLKWQKNPDGTYKDPNKKNKIAYSRIMVANVVFKKPIAGHANLTIANVHLHHLTAKASQGFKTALNSFFDNLAEIILKYGVRVLTGDFNMSMYQVVPMLRDRKVAIHLAAWFPWMKGGELQVDSCGIFLCGPCSRIQRVIDEEAFVHDVRGGGRASASSIAEHADENQEADENRDCLQIGN